MKNQTLKKTVSFVLAVVMTVLVLPTAVISTAAQTTFEVVTELETWQSVGYGFNAITGNMSNPEPTANAILDFEKMESAGFDVIGFSKTGADGGYFKSQTVSEISDSYTNEFSVALKASLPIAKVNLGIEGKFSSKYNSSSSDTVSELYQMYYSNAIRNKYSLRGYDGNVADLRANLSARFEAKLAEIEQNAQNSEDVTEPIKQLFEYYGTHLILSYYTGGRLEITDHLTSTETKTEQQLTEASSLGVSVGVGSFSIEADIENTDTVSNASVGTAVEESIKIKNFGGLYPELNVFTSAAYTNWLNSLNDTKNQTMIGFVNDYSLIPVWELVDDKDLQAKIYAVFNDQCRLACSDYYTKYIDNASKVVGYVYKNASVDNYAYVDINSNGADLVAPGSTLYLDFYLSTDYISANDITYEISDGSGYASIDEKNGILTVSPDATDKSVITVLIKAGGVQLSAQSFEVMTEGENGFAGGYGTKERPYLLSKPDHLACLVNTSDYATDAKKHFMLIQDINVDGKTLEIIPSFAGTFDGNGFAIYNFLIDSTKDVTGLFGEIASGATVKNLQIGKSEINEEGNQTYSGIDGYSAKIYAHEDFYTFYVGGLVGINNGTVENCKVVNTLVKGYTNWNASDGDYLVCVAGGLIGLNMGFVTDCEVASLYLDSDVKTSTDLNNPSCSVFSGGLIGMDGCYIPPNWNGEENTKKYKEDNTIINSIVRDSTIDSYVKSQNSIGWNGEGYIRSGGLIGLYEAKTTKIKNCIVCENAITAKKDVDEGNSRYGSFIGDIPDGEYNIHNCYAGVCNETKYEIGNILDIEDVTGNLTLEDMYSKISTNASINSYYIVSKGCWPQLYKFNAIELNTTGVKTAYEKGEIFNPLGLIVKEKYDDNRAVQEIHHFSISAEPFLSLGTQEITVKSYGGYQKTFNVSVICNHPSPAKVMGTEATCTATGLTDGLYCSDCGVWLEEQMTVDKSNDHTFGDWTNHDAAQHKRSCACGAVEFADHVWGKGVVTTTPTETSEGIMTYTCGICGGTKTEPIQKLPDENAPTIKVGSYTATAGEIFTVEVRIENNVGFAYLEVKPTYSSELTLLNVENGDLISDFTKGNQYIWIADEDVTADGLLLTMTIQVKETAEAGEYSVGFTVRTCGNYNEENVTMAVIPGTITVVDFVYGDATGDGNVNGFDIIRLKKYLANYDDETGVSTVEIGLGADATGDGNVNGFDIIRLKKYLANYDDETGSSTVVLGPAK